MRHHIMKAMTNVCALALALTPFLQYKPMSLLFFGEPKYPM